MSDHITDKFRGILVFMANVPILWDLILNNFCVFIKIVYLVGFSLSSFNGLQFVHFFSNEHFSKALHFTSVLSFTWICAAFRPDRICNLIWKAAAYVWLGGLSASSQAHRKKLVWGMYAENASLWRSGSVWEEGEAPLLIWRGKPSSRWDGDPWPLFRELTGAALNSHPWDKLAMKRDLLLGAWTCHSERRHSGHSTRHSPYIADFPLPREASLAPRYPKNKDSHHKVSISHHEC